MRLYQCHPELRECIAKVSHLSRLPPVFRFKVITPEALGKLFGSFCQRRRGPFSERNSPSQGPVCVLDKFSPSWECFFFFFLWKGWGKGEDGALEGEREAPCLTWELIRSGSYWGSRDVLGLGFYLLFLYHFFFFFFFHPPFQREGSVWWHLFLLRIKVQLLLLF